MHPARPDVRSCRRRSRSAGRPRNAATTISMALTTSGRTLTTASTAARSCSFMTATASSIDMASSVIDCERRCSVRKFERSSIGYKIALYVARATCPCAISSAGGPCHRYGFGVMEPSTTRRRAPVTDGRFDGIPSSVAAPSSANAIASFASGFMPSTSVVRIGAAIRCRMTFMIAAFCIPPPLTITSPINASPNTALARAISSPTSIADVAS